MNPAAPLMGGPHTGAGGGPIVVAANTRWYAPAAVLTTHSTSGYGCTNSHTVNVHECEYGSPVAVAGGWIQGNCNHYVSSTDYTGIYIWVTPKLAAQTITPAATGQAYSYFTPCLNDPSYYASGSLCIIDGTTLNVKSLKSLNQGTDMGPASPNVGSGTFNLSIASGTSIADGDRLAVCWMYKCYAGFAASVQIRAQHYVSTSPPASDYSTPLDTAVKNSWFSLSCDLTLQ